MMRSGQSLLKQRFARICHLAGPALFKFSLAVVVLFGAAQAASAAERSGPARYALKKVPSGYLRIDRDSGQVSLCQEQSVGWTCRLVADDRTALLREIERLRTQNNDTPDRRAETPLAPTPPAVKPQQPLTATPKPPAQTDGEKRLARTDSSFRRFVAFTRNLRNRLAGNAPGQTR